MSYFARIVPPRIAVLAAEFCNFINFFINKVFLLFCLLLSFSPFLTRNEETTDDSGKHFGCYQQDHSNLY